MVYAKQMKDGVVTALVKYYYEPQFTEDSPMVVITEEEYNSLVEELKTRPRPDVPTVTERQISDSEALAIITGEVSADDA